MVTLVTLRLLVAAPPPIPGQPPPIPGQPPPVPAPAVPGASAARVAEHAREAFQREDYAEALRLLDQAHRLEPKPVYVYNMGRSLERLGRLREAHAMFLRMRATSGADPNLTRLAEAQIAKLAPLVKKALVRLSGAPMDALVLLDGAVVTDVDQDRTLRPGRHDLCVVAAGGADVSCWQREAAEGVRSTWQIPPAEARPVATLGWVTNPAVVSLGLDGHPLPVALEALKRIEVSAGEHVVEITLANKDVWRLVVQAAPGATYPLAAVLTGELVPGVRATHVVWEEPGPGPWPWVLLGSGVAVVAGGAVLVALGAADAATVEDAGKRVDGVTYGLSQKEAHELLDRADGETGGGAAMIVVGAGLTLGGVLWAALADYGDAAEGADAGLQLTPALGPGHAGFALSGRF